MAGCLCLMFSIAAFGLSLATIQGPILNSMNGSSYFSVLTVICSIALCVMTPVGGRLTDMIGGSRLILLFGTISIIAGLVMAFVPNLWIFMSSRIILAAASGAYASLPYILMRQIYPPNQAPKAIGYLTMLAALGGLAGSYIAGWLEDAGHMNLAIGFPVLPLAIGVFLIARNLKIKPSIPFKLDWTGIALLTVSLTGLLLALNNGPTSGWFSLTIILSFGTGLAALLAFIAWENKTDIPIIPMRMFAIKEYSLLLVIGFCLMFYMNAMNYYIPLAVQNILQAGSAVSGALQIPRTIMAVLLPAACGTWVVKKTGNIWKGLAYAAIALVICFGMLVFIGINMPVWFIMAMLALTGISDSFRAVSLLPACQSCLDMKDIGVGTSMIGFISTLAGSIASAFFGLCYDSLTAATPGLRGMTDGIDTICLLTAVTAFIGLLLILLFFRPAFMKRAKEKQAS